MSRRYRFLTNPRIFSFFTERKMKLVEIFFMFFLYSAVSALLVIHFVSKQDRAREATLEARVEKAEAEVRHLKAAETNRNGTPRAVPTSIKGASETALMPPAPDDNVVAMSDDTVEVVQSGRLKGLPLDVAKEIQEEYRVAHMARATRYHEWHLRSREHRERDKAWFEKESAHWEASRADSKRRRENLLAFFALMSPEQLEAARKEVLKTQPAEDVDLFFTHVAEYGTAKSSEQIEQEKQALAENQEALAIEWRELEVEREQLDREREEINRTKPPLPNDFFEEFYTDLKKRNSTKPKP